MNEPHWTEDDVRKNNPDLFADWEPPRPKFYASFHRARPVGTGMLELGIRLELTEGRPALTVLAGIGSLCIGWFYA